MTGRRLVPVVLGLALLAAGAEAAVDVGASLDHDSIRAGDQVVLTVTVTGDARNVEPPTLPALTDFRIFRGGQSQRFSFVNGQASAEHTFTYYLQPQSEGRFTIGAIEIVADGQTVRTPPLKLEVLAAEAARPSDSEPAPDPRDDDAPAQDAFVTMDVDRDTVVVGEQVVLTFGFYRATRLSAFDSPEYTPPRTEGFWREDLPPERHTTRVIRSRRYQVTEIQYALFPTRAGNLTIGEAIVRLPDDPFGNFFRRNDRRRSSGPKVLRAAPINVHVQSLPEPVPSGFTGTVAEGLRLDATVDRRELDEGEAVTLALKLEGTGNLPGAALPDLDFLEDAFRVHDAGGGADKRPQGGRLRGVRLVESLLVPRTAGTVVIPSVEYTYFDTGRRDYVTLSTQPIALEVNAVEGGGAGVFVGGRKSEIELLARDIQHIAPVPGTISPWSGPLPNRVGFYAAIAVPALAWVVSTGLARRREKLLADPRRHRQARALSDAQRELKSEGAAAEVIVRALHGWAADRFDRAAAGLTHDEVVDLVTGHGAGDALARRLRTVLERCDAARFAPLGSDADDLKDETRVLLDQLEEATRA